METPKIWYGFIADFPDGTCFYRTVDGGEVEISGVYRSMDEAPKGWKFVGECTNYLRPGRESFKTPLPKKK